MRFGGRHRSLWPWLAGTVALVALSGHATARDPDVKNTLSGVAAPFSGAATGFGNLVRPDTNQPLNLEGDELIYDSAGQTVTARGNVEIIFNNYRLRADEVTYDQGAGTLTAVGNVTLTEPGGIVTRGERITLTDDFRDAFVESLSVVGRDQTRITARRAIRRDGNVNIFEDGKFTPCRTDGGAPPLWCLSAARVVHDMQAATISYEDVAFEFFGQPLLYLPYFSHPDPSVKRKSGFLQPGYRYSDRLGFGGSVPYYFALAPNYDLTVTPTYYTEQGLFLEAEWRHKVAFGNINGVYTIKLAGIDQDGDNLPNDGNDNEDLDGFRGSLETEGVFSLASWWRFGWDITIESDDSFRKFYKLDSVLQKDRVNQVSLVGQSERNYFSAWGYHFGGLNFDETPTAESRVHPVVDWNYIVGAPILGGELSFNANALSLTRDLNLDDDGELASHQRLSAEIGWRRRLTDRIGITYEPFANLRGDFFNLTDTFNARSLERDNDSFGRGVASAGVLAEYPWLARSRAGSHVIAPIGQLIARTQLGDDQERLPNEDSRSLVFDDTNLFEVDKFSGFDRVETGSRANVGIQYTFQADSGGYARLLAGLSFQLDDENPFQDPGAVPIDDNNNDDDFDEDGETEPSFTDDSGLESRRSDVVLGAYLAPTSVFQLIGQSRFDEEDFSLEQIDVFSKASFGPVFASATYSFTSNATARDNAINLGLDPNDPDLSDQQELVANIGLRVTENWTVSAGMRYDIDNDFVLQQSAGIKYADECFVLSVTYTGSEIEDPDRDIEPDQQIMIRFDLKHLGQFQTESSIAGLLNSDSES